MVFVFVYVEEGEGEHSPLSLIVSYQSVYGVCVCICGRRGRGGGTLPAVPDRVLPECVVFLSCPLVKKHADLSGSFLYSQSTMKDMYSKPTNRTELSIPVKTKSIA